MTELTTQEMQAVDGGFDPVTVTLGLGLLAIAGTAFMFGYKMATE